MKLEKETRLKKGSKKDKNEWKMNEINAAATAEKKKKRKRKRKEKKRKRKRKEKKGRCFARHKKSVLILQPFLIFFESHLVLSVVCRLSSFLFANAPQCFSLRIASSLK